MLTIKQVKTSGSEQIYELKAVEYLADQKNEWRQRKLILELSDGTKIEKANHGTFYVMNEKGHTISKYFLGPDEEILKNLKEGAVPLEFLGKC